MQGEKEVRLYPPLFGMVERAIDSQDHLRCRSSLSDDWDGARDGVDLDPGSVLHPPRSQGHTYHLDDSPDAADVLDRRSSHKAFGSPVPVSGIHDHWEGNTDIRTDRSHPVSRTENLDDGVVGDPRPEVASPQEGENAELHAAQGLHGC